MTAPNAYVVRNCSVKIGATDYANQVTKAQLVPNTPIQTLKTLVPDGVVQDVDITTWTLELSGVQDWTSGTGIADELNSQNGAQLSMTLVPKAGTGNPEATFTVVALPVDFGGQQGNFATFDVTLPVVGDPTFGTAA